MCPFAPQESCAIRLNCDCTVSFPGVWEGPVSLKGFPLLFMWHYIANWQTFQRCNEGAGLLNLGSTKRYPEWSWFNKENSLNSVTTQRKSLVILVLDGWVTPNRTISDSWDGDPPLASSQSGSKDFNPISTKDRALPTSTCIQRRPLSLREEHNLAKAMEASPWEPEQRTWLNSPRTPEQWKI